MPFAQLVTGPPGSGKSTYCDGMLQFMGAIGRPCSVVNLDPANDHTSYKAALDVRDLINLEEIMSDEQLGPNGGVLYALEELEHNFDWLTVGLKKLEGDYIIFDCPGQVELFTHHASLRNIFFKLQELGYRLVVLQLIDSYVLTQPSLYISALLLALRTMLQMDMTHLNVLTKIDNLINFPPLLFNLDFYTEVQDLSHILPHLNAERSGQPPSDAEGGDDLDGNNDGEEPKSKFHALNNAIIELVQDFGLVGFETLAVEDKSSMANLLKVIDRAGGYAFQGAHGEGANETVWQVAMREGAMMDVKDVQERWIDRREELDEVQRKQWEEEGRAWRAEEDARDAAERLANTAPTGGDDLNADLMEGVKLPSGRDGGIKVVRKEPPDPKG